MGEWGRDGGGMGTGCGRDGGGIGRDGGMGRDGGGMGAGWGRDVREHGGMTGVGEGNTLLTRLRRGKREHFSHLKRGIGAFRARPGSLQSPAAHGQGCAALQRGDKSAVYFHPV